MNIPFPILPNVMLPGAGPTVGAFGDHVTFHVTGAQTDNRYTIFSNTTPPGGGPPPHRHEFDDEFFMVIEGQAEFLKDGEWIAVPAGGCVYMPRGTVHTFRNSGDVPLKQIIQASPSGFEIFFTRCAEEFDKPGGPDMAKIIEISAEHGITYV